MRTIEITKPASTTATMVKVYDSGILTETYISNKGEDYLTDGAYIRFPFNRHLEDLNMKVETIGATTMTNLSSPTDNYELVEAFASSEFFQKEA